MFFCPFLKKSQEPAFKNLWDFLCILLFTLLINSLLWSFSFRKNESIWWILNSSAHLYSYYNNHIIFVFIYRFFSLSVNRINVVLRYLHYIEIPMSPVAHTRQTKQSEKKSFEWMKQHVILQLAAKDRENTFHLYIYSCFWWFVWLRKLNHNQWTTSELPIWVQFEEEYGNWEFIEAVTVCWLCLPAR